MGMEKDVGNGLAEIKQISVAVCPSARPSVDNL